MSLVDSVGSDTDLTYDCENTSNYALQVALKTMRERCQQLQKRLAVVENENSSLRLQNREKISLTSDGVKCDVESLQDRIAQLTKQKSQLAHNVYMVAAENRHLWTRLSKLTDVNNTLGTQLLKINDTLNQHKVVASPPITTNLIRSKTFTQNSPRTKHKNGTDNDVSLEEISLKLIDSFLKEKTELEDQYAQMVEMQADSNIDVNSIGFSYPEESDEDESLNEFKKCSEQLLMFKNTLLNQQSTLKSALTALKHFQSEGSFCTMCQEKKRERRNTTTVKTLEEPEKEFKSQIEKKTDRLCPMCGTLFAKSISMIEYHNHVESHFVDDSITDNYEIITTFGT